MLPGTQCTLRSATKRITSAGLVLGWALLPYSAQAQGSDDHLWDISLEELGQIRVVSIASGTATPLDKAAAITSVINADEIAAMGATDLDQVLETVPGLHVTHSDQVFSSKYIFRGITSSFNPQALLLVNGIPVTTMMFGNRGNAWGGMPVKAIKRIEVIRGPGSALYGADAYAGVINIITKDWRDTQGGVIGGRIGSFNSRGGWLEAGNQYDDLGVSLILEYQSTDGWRETIDHDAQTNFDTAFGTSASLAPGPVNTAMDQLDARLDVGTDNWRLRAGLQDRKNLGTGPGVAQALDPEGQFGSQRINVDYTYNWKELVEGFDAEARVSYFNITQEPENDIILFPAGAFGGLFPDGFIGSPGYKEHQARFDLSSVYRGFDDHRLHAGIGGLWADLYEVTESKNFNPDFSPKGAVVDVSDDPDQVWMPEEDRTSYYAFLQDEWQFAQNWQLVSGVRYDHYSDFGQTINPRAALIWATTDSITTKLLYGRAFRAPSLNELHVANNPVVQGNPDLDPETIDTVELAFAHQVTSDLFYGFNLFHYEIEDLITQEAIPGAVATEHRNSGERTGHGGEFELSYQPLDVLTLVANYAYQDAEDDRTGESMGEAPNHQAYVRTEWQLTPKLQLTTQVNWVGEQDRGAMDARDPVDDYTTVDLTLRTNDTRMPGLGLSLAIRNLFDQDVRDPSPFAAPVPSVPGDFPMAGRNLVGEVKYAF
ncbi:TonB-dependent receptor plug domain-containing protein [Marinobacter sp. SS21]|uniref:TonB-dependent receptor plug domain-containing protein n=1 Tax=Marinobacter sp. SS21 TaxID=2979460 RepID=UPI00232B8989|nr:TonB-dependent receptor [Marinobacter sp. SS21]MDC0664281.1 TonB-dependent receptor [Marinobacter sp. SS21]